MNAWIEFTQDEYRDVWDRFYAYFKFRPDYHEHVLPAINEPEPHIVVDLSAEFSDTGIDNVNEQFDSAFHQLARQGHDRLVALDWQHTCYWFFPLRPSTTAPLSVFPDGDYYAFVSPDFSFGTFGHPWQRSLCVFGKPLLQLLPNIETMGPVLRRSGI